MKYIIDSYAWIEYLDGSHKGDKVREVLAKDGEIYIIALTVSEVISRAKRKSKDTTIAYETIIMNSKIIDITPEMANDAGLFHAEIRKRIKDFGLVDSLMLIAAHKLGAKILTGDAHFKGFREAILI